jgi:SAM-dependent methyltransferase
LNETAKACARRIYQPGFRKWIQGKVLDVGPGSDSLAKWAYLFPDIVSVDGIDLYPGFLTYDGRTIIGDATRLLEVDDDTYDTVHSSHCLEHTGSPYEALKNWIRVCKPGGHIVIVVPDADMYEGRVFPSRWNSDHKWMLSATRPSEGRLVNLVELVASIPTVGLVYLNLLEATWPGIPDVDHTLNPVTESAIELVLRRMA